MLCTFFQTENIMCTRRVKNTKNIIVKNYDNYYQICQMCKLMGELAEPFVYIILFYRNEIYALYALLLRPRDDNQLFVLFV